MQSIFQQGVTASRTLKIVEELGNSPKKLAQRIGDYVPGFGVCSKLMD